LSTSIEILKPRTDGRGLFYWPNLSRETWLSKEEEEEESLPRIPSVLLYKKDLFYLRHIAQGIDKPQLTGQSLGHGQTLVNRIKPEPSVHL
jgi:hypothetical protein